MDKMAELKGGKMYLCESAGDTIEILRGHVLIYIVPVKEQAGRRAFIYEAVPGELVPSFSYMDYAGDRWKLGFAAVDMATLKIIPEEPSEELKADFAERAGIRSYEDEGFEDGLVEKYQLNIVAEDGFIYKTEQEQKQVYEDSLSIIYNVFHKKSRLVKTGRDNKNPLYEAVAWLCEKEHIEIAPFARVREGCGKNITVNDIARISHFICRRVVLPESWYKSDSGALLVFDAKSGAPYACVPRNSSSYYIYDPVARGKRVLKREEASAMDPEAYMVYRPFANRALTTKDLVRFSVRSIRGSDVALMLLFMFAGSLIGLLIPVLNQVIYDSYIPMGDSSVLIQTGGMILAFMIGNIAFSIVRGLAGFRISSKIEYDSQGAAYSRLFNLKEEFFRSYDSADLAQRVMGVSSYVTGVMDIIMGIALSALLAVIYFLCMLRYSGELSLACLLMLAIYSVVVAVLTLRTMKYTRKRIELDGRGNSVMYQFLNGISKIRTTGVEDRALYEYLKPYTESCKLGAKESRLNIMVDTFESIGWSLLTLVLYYLMIHRNLGITMGAFIAFSSASGSFSGAFLGIVEDGLRAFQLKPYYDRIRPILEAVPEYDDRTELPGDLRGEIEISNLTFGYAEDTPVLKNLSLNIKEGEYVGIVGPSGCGKSTLFKLLLGFETPQTGKIYYDKKDIESFDKCELRKKLGVVLQDGRLISGSIYENITITAPDVDMERVLETIRDVGLESDIDQMPMGIHTIVSEDSGNISGGQQQRILIARAIAGKPRVLLFDEATSALDNVTQAMVCESIEKLNATRIVIAHRLSTVIRCDRIIVLDRGSILESGTYGELMEKKGYFYEMAKRQIA